MGDPDYSTPQQPQNETMNNFDNIGRSSPQAQQQQQPQASMNSQIVNQGPSIGTQSRYSARERMPFNRNAQRQTSTIFPYHTPLTQIDSGDEEPQGLKQQATQATHERPRTYITMGANTQFKEEAKQSEASQNSMYAKFFGK